jgi:hypothetical protein
MTEEQKQLRDMAAIFALTMMGNKLGAGIKHMDIATECYEIADAMMIVRDESDKAGLPAIKRSARHDNKSNRIG